MITRILDSKLPLIVYNPSKVFDKNYFISSYDAGALPVLDTEFFNNSKTISIIEDLSKSDLLFGVRLSINNKELLDFLNNNLFINIDVIVFSYNKTDELDNFSFTNRDYKILIETIDIKINDKLEKISPHGLILKGNEAAGKVSRFTSMILMQYYLEKSSFSVFIHGGVGLHTSAGIFAAGAHGIVLDNQLYLTEEAPLTDNFKELMSNIKEGDSIVVGETLNNRYRFFAKLGTKIVKDLKVEESLLKDNDEADVVLYSKIKEKIEFIDNDKISPVQSLFYLGQDAVFAKHFVKKSNKIKDVIHNLFDSIGSSLNDIDEFDPLVADSKLAKDNNTKYPIMQGPMANVNDNAEFAHNVYENGGLPFFAMGNLPTDLAEKAISQGKDKFDNFGAGLIGTPEINKFFEEHLGLIKKYKVPYVLIAVGIPSYVNRLESEGVITYLHTPALQMLENAITNNCKRFIFEGNEAGGHIGNLLSFVLWEISVEKLLNQRDETLSSQSVIFAGGIASKSGSSFISGMSVNLAKRGAKVGIQVGTPYLLTEEIVDSGAIKKLYRDTLIEGDETKVIGNTVGLSTRTVISPFSKKMLQKEHQLIKDKVPLSERKEYFENHNVGSLLIAAKAFTPDFEKLKKGEGLSLIHFNDDEHYEKGNFHTGESIAFFDNTITIKELHESFFEKKSHLMDNLNSLEVFSSEKNQINDEVAIIGMGCIYPDAPNPEQFWDNIVSKKYSIYEVPDSRLDSKLYCSDDRTEEDKSYSNIAGMVDYYKFDYEKYGYKKTEAKHISRTQKMILDAAMQAVDNAGYLNGKELPKEKTSVIVGSCLGNEYGDDMFLYIYYPEMLYHLEQIEEFKSLSDEDKEKLVSELKKGLAKGYKPKTPDGAALNVESARIAKHLDLRGRNYTIDAACATSLAALDNAKKELLTGDSDMVIVGGVHTLLSPETFVGFCKMGALSGVGSFPFDERAAGFVLGEGAGVVVLKRVRDAIRDGDTIHAIINGIGSSSDGKGKAIAAPKSDGQAYAIHRAFENSITDISPGDVGYVEAHGTATLMGDSTEIATIKKVYKSDSPIGVSSIKSQIGHLLGGAGAAGLIKATLSIKNKTLPPNGKFENLSSKFTLDDSSIYIIDEPKEWKIENNKKRMAGISSFGFGGINYHIIVGEFNEDYKLIKRSIFNDLDYDFNDDRIVIGGVGVVLPGAKNRDEFWNIINKGENTISEIPDTRFHNDLYTKVEDPVVYLPKVKAGLVQDYEFNNLKFRIPPSTLKVVDRVQRFAIDAATQSIEQANIIDEFTNGNRIGVIMGTSSGELHNEHIFRTRIPLIKKILSGVKNIDSDKRDAIISKFDASLKERYHKNTEDTIPGLLSNIVSGRIANYYNCNGPNYTIEAECASSAVAFSISVKELLTKECDYIIAGGADANLAPANLKAYQMIKVLSSGVNKVFDKNSSGLVMSEGAAVLVLTTYKKAKETNMEILGELSKFSFNSYGAENFIAPTTEGFTRVMDNFNSNSQIKKNQVDYIDVFASSHVVVDSWERDAIANYYNHEIFFGNIKPEIGYFRSANPAVVLAKLTLMGYNKKILPNFSFSPEDTIVEKDSILKGLNKELNLSNRDSINLAVNFSGLGGNHGHTVLRTMPGRFTKKDTASKPAFALQASAVAESFETGRVKIAALLSGQGAQHSGMMKELYNSNSHIKSIMDQGERIFKENRGYSLLDMMFGKDDAINSTENTQPAVFLSTAAIHSYLKLNGFNPDYYIGHSVGEFSALYCAGILDFKDAMELILKRSEIMKEIAHKVRGFIMVAFVGPSSVQKYIEKSKISNIYIANKNSEKQTAVSGGEAEIDRFCEFLKKEDVMFRKLNLSGAFHSPLFSEASEKLNEYFKNVKFNKAEYSKVISNVTGECYPDDESKIKELLVKQLTSPVEFIKSVEVLSNFGVKHFLEIGPNRILTNLLRDINIKDFNSIPSINPKAGQIKSFEKFIEYLKENSIFSFQKVKEVTATKSVEALETIQPDVVDSEFNEFLKENKESLNMLLYKEFQYKRGEKLLESYNRFKFYTGKIVISGVSIGLPGSSSKVFDVNNFDKILSGVNLIESLDEKEKNKIKDKNITRVFKSPNGNAKFQEINSTDDVIKLAGKLGYFDLNKEYGIDFDYDITNSLAIAAGIEALKDAGIPLVMEYHKTTTGNVIQKGYTLPEEMQDTTGVIFTSLFSSFESMISEINSYNEDRAYNRYYKKFEGIYYFLMEQATDSSFKEKITEWFFDIKNDFKEPRDYKFDRNLLLNIMSLASTHFAQIIRAKGPNTQINAACASTTQAVGIAEDWIRTGRCERVIIIGGEAATSEIQNEWIGSGFLAMGAATVKNTVSEAAKPFDKNRNGMILGSGAVAMIIEREETVRDRGFNGQAEVLGTFIGNSAFHASRLDVDHIAPEMKKFFRSVEKAHNLQKSDYVKSLLFMSHETYTPARGGSADAEISAIKSSFPRDYTKITISNSKGFTGHMLGVAIEDAVLVKAMQTGIAPPIANLTDIPEEFSDLNFSKGNKSSYEFGVHFSAGFGSQFSLLFIKRIRENSKDNNVQYQNWLKRVSGNPNPELKFINNTLCILQDDSVVKARMKPELKIEQKATIPVQAKNEELVGKIPTEAIQEKIKSIIADQTGYTVDMLEPDLDLEADLGIDTVKQVEVFGKITSEYNLEVPDDLKLSDLNTIAKITSYIGDRVSTVITSQVSQQADTGEILRTIKNIVSDQTGYTVDMLEADLDLEADLGIDTVKQVEVFGKITSEFDLSVPEDLKLSELNTISKITTYVGNEIQKDVSARAPVDSAASVLTASSGADTGKILKTVQEIISDQTGYTVDMLEADLDLEADLGIDTVKQVEIFGKITSEFDINVPEDLKLSELNTILKIATYVGNEVEGDVTAAAPVVSAALSGADTGKILKTVQEIISDQTGYTVDMLEADLDLEADLGIDTVKQVEVFGKITSEFDLDVPEDLKLSELNTISKIASYVGREVSGNAEISAVTSSPSALAATAEVKETASSIKRFVVEMEKTDLPKDSINIFKNKKIIVTTDKYGFAENIIKRIKNHNGEVITLGKNKSDDVKIDFSNIDSIDKTVKELTEKHSDLAGFIHLLPIDYYFNKNEIDEDEINASVKSMFLTIKGLFDSFNKPGSFISIVSFDSVIFPYSDLDVNIHPSFSGITGLIKTANKELKETLVKSVDFSYKDPLKNIDEISDLYIKELMSGDRRVETGYHKKEKYIISLKQKSAEKGENFVKPGDTVIATGGARGITFEIIKEFVKRNNDIKLILLGRSDIKNIELEFLQENANEQFIFSSLKEKMKGSKPLEIKRATSNILNLKETHSNIEYLKSQGVDIQYHAIDVSNFDVLNDFIKKVKKVDGIIHAAGVEDSNFIIKKDIKNFNRVFDTKIIGVLNLLKALKGIDYNFIIGFSSVTAKFGNEGQADYTAANDMLGKLLQREKVKNPEINIKVFDWTAWKDIGMATNESVKKVLLESGIELLPIHMGVNFFMDDLYDHKHNESLITNVIPEFDVDNIFPESADVIDKTKFPFLGNVIEENNGQRIYSRVLDIKNDIFLLHHILNDVPLFLGATGIETLVEAASSMLDDKHIIWELTDFKIPYGIKILKGQAKEIIINSKKNGSNSGNFECSIISQFKNKKGEPIGDPKLHYEGKLKFITEEPEKIKVDIPEFSKVEYQGNFDKLAYHPNRLFMDGLFKTIDDILSFRDNVLITKVLNKSDQKYFNHIKSPELKTDAIIIDGMFQTGGLFEFISTNEVVLPYTIKSMKFYRDIVTSDEYMCITRKTASDDKTNTYQLDLVDNEGNLYVSVEDFEMIRLGNVEDEYKIKDKFKFDQ